MGLLTVEGIYKDALTPCARTFMTVSIGSPRALVDTNIEVARRFRRECEGWDR